MFAELKTGYRNPALPTHDISSRDIRKMDFNALKADVGALQLVLTTFTAFTATSGLWEVLDNHAPLGHRRITDGHSAPWLTVQI